MRNVKKFLALVLAMLMVVSAAATVSAFEDVADDHVFAAAINDLTVKEIVNGYDGETFGPDDAVTRQQMALMMARAITGNVGDDAVWAQGGLVGFEDVTEYQYAIATVVKAGIVDGFLDNTFRPEEGITFVQALKMAVCALGYDDGNLEWWNGYYNVALDLGLTENLNYITDADKALNRGEVAQLIYNMLYVELADGSDCFASQNFGLATSGNVTTFVITATDEQTAAEGMDVTEGGYVGLQQLVNGVPEGDVCYVPVEMLGFEEDEDEEYFLHAFNVVNWDAKTASFDQIIPTGNVEVIYNDAISGKSGASAYNRFKYDGANYYVVDELTGTAIKNEVVLYNATDFGYTTDNKQLFLNKEGQVLDEEGEPILEAVYAVNGDVVSYRAIRSTLDGKVTKGEYLSVAKATALYGAEIGYVAVPFATMDVDALTEAYQLTIFDDDMDGKMDRAYWTPVYVSVYAGVNSSNVHQTVGPLKKGAFDDDDGKVTGMEDLAKGDVFVYTFNEQLREVTVLEVLEVEQGTVKKINTTTNKKSNWYSTITLTDGTALKIYNKAEAAASANAALVANVQASGSVDYKDADGWMYQITDDLVFELVNDDTLLNILESGDLIRYYARNGVILFAETYDVDEVFDRIVLKEVIDADLEAIYVDAYVDGEVEELAVTRLVVDDETITLADKSWLQISKILSNLDLNEGYVYRASELENGYQISVALNDKNEDNTDDAKNAPAAFNLFAVDLKNGQMNIEDNVVTDDNGYGRTNRLRTTEDTIWYFIDETTVKNKNTTKRTVKVFSGELDDAYITVDGDTRIFADKVGYANMEGCKNKGVATVVYVFDAAAVNGFGWGADDYSVVFMTAMTKTDTDYYEQGNAEDVGLNAKEYTASNYYKYSSSYAIDMFSGKATTVYSTFLLKNNTAYTVNEDGFVLDTKGTNSNDKLMEIEISFADIDYEDEYITIDNGTSKKSNVILDASAEIEKIYALKKDATTGNIKKTESAVDDIIVPANGDYTVLVLENEYYGYDADDQDADEDGIYVIIVGGFDAEEEDDEDVETVFANAKYNSGNKVYASVAYDFAVNDAVFSGTAYRTETEFEYYEDVEDVVKELNSKVTDAEITAWNIATEAKPGTAVYSDATDGITATVEIDEDSVFTFEFEMANSSTSPNATKWKSLTKGDYILTVTVEYNTGSTGEFTIFFTIA